MADRIPEPDWISRGAESPLDEVFQLVGGLSVPALRAVKARKAYQVALRRGKEAVVEQKHSGVICGNTGQDLPDAFADKYCVTCWLRDAEGHGFLHRWYIDRDDCYQENAVHESEY